MELQPGFDFLPKPAKKLDLNQFSEPVPPKIPVKTLKPLMKLANKFQKLEPWKQIQEQDLFGFRDPKSGALYLVSVLGGDEGLFSLHCHMPPEGVVFWQNAFRGVDVDMAPGLTEIRLLECDFVAEQEACPEDVTIYKKNSTKKETGKWVPSFRSYRPGFYPWFFEREEAEQMIQVFELFFRFYEDIFPKRTNFYQWENPFGELPGIPVFYMAEDNQEEEWSVHMEVLPSECLAPLKPRPDSDPHISILEKLPIAQETWEIGSFFMPTPIFNGERPYYPKSAICLRASEEGSRCPVDPTIYGGDKDPQDVEVIRQVFKEFVKHCSYLPEQIRVDSEITMAAMEVYADELDIEVTFDEQLLMPVLVSEIISSLEDTDRNWDEELLDEVIKAIPPEFQSHVGNENMEEALQSIAAQVLQADDDDDSIVALPDNIIYAEFAEPKKASGDGTE